MIKNYLTIAVRSLINGKTYSVINVAGLATGMACCILILLYVRDEMGYDEHHKHAHRIFRLVEEAQVAGNTRRVAMTPFPMGPALVEDYPEVIDAVRFDSDDEKTVVGPRNVHFYEEGVWFVDENVFKMFHLPLSKGDMETALKEPHSVVVSEEIARKYFGEREPMGQLLSIGGDEFEVTGVLKDVDHNTHFQIAFLASPIRRKDWIDHSYYTYLLLRSEDSARELKSKLPEFIDRHLGEKLKASGIELRPYLQPLTDIHLRSRLEFEMSANGDIRRVYLFLVISGFVLLLACVNFINLSTAQSAGRAKEVGIRKAMGASRSQLICQFLGESTLVALLALFLAAILVEVMLPAFNAFLSRELSIFEYKNWDFMWVLIGIVVFAGIFSGSYPALLLSAFQPVDVLKGRLVGGSGKSNHQRPLVILQSGISVVLIIGTIVVHSQSDYTRNKPLGFDKEHVIVIPVSGKDVVERYRSRVAEYTNVLSVSASSSVPGREIAVWLFRPHLDVNYDGTLMMNVIHADHRFIETFGIELVEGRSFSKDLSSDNKGAFILNQSAMRKLGWTTTSAGKELQVVYPRDGALKVEVEGDVVGLVRDFHYRSLHHEIEPLVIMTGSGWTDYCSIRIGAGEVLGTIAYLEAQWREIVPDVPFEYLFLDDIYDKLHRAEDHLGKMFGFFAIFAIFEASLGLLGLASFTARRRRKEIGVRKILGATVSHIVLKLSKEVAVLVGFANLVAWPIAYYAADRWLQDFAYRVDLDISPFVLGGILSLFIALATTSLHTWKAAQTNPANVLRYE